MQIDAVVYETNESQYATLMSNHDKSEDPGQEMMTSKSNSIVIGDDEDG